METTSHDLVAKLADPDSVGMAVGITRDGMDQYFSSNIYNVPIPAGCNILRILEPDTYSAVAVVRLPENVRWNDVIHSGLRAIAQRDNYPGWWDAYTRNMKPQKAQQVQ